MTTACSDSPSKLKRASPLLASVGGGALAAAWLIGAALPRLDLLVCSAAGFDQRALADTLELLVGRGATVILVAHELGPIAPLVTRTVVMRDGRVVHDGPPHRDGDDPGHGHHHHLDHVVDHAPSVAGPLDSFGPTYGTEPR